MQLGSSVSANARAQGGVKLLNAAGRQLELRCDLRAPFCMWLAAQASMAVSNQSFTGAGLEPLRRYEIAQVCLPVACCCAASRLRRCR
jgi:hypothetical protein